VSLGGVFFGESMFSLVKDSSKIAFVHLLEQMGYSLIDCQVESPHLNSLGAFNIERHAFIQSLKELL
jgi:leucyl/phenylalanyl-tRNA--protein transferase